VITAAKRVTRLKFRLRLSSIEMRIMYIMLNQIIINLDLSCRGSVGTLL